MKCILSWKYQTSRIQNNVDYIQETIHIINVYLDQIGILEIYIEYVRGRVLSKT